MTTQHATKGEHSAQTKCSLFEEKPNWERTNRGLEIKTNQIETNKPIVFKILID